jgi:Uma2 family endonuclease
MTQVRLFTVDEYFALERASDVKHEYIDGEIRLVPGATEQHNLILWNLAKWLMPDEDDAEFDCIGAGPDMRVQIDEARYVYPDLVMTCGERHYLAGANPPTLLNPTLIIEILSQSTAEYDPHEKLELYKAIPSVQQIVIVEQFHPRLVIHTRDEATWHIAERAGLASSVVLDSIGVSIPLKRIYRKVRFE